MDIQRLCAGMMARYEIDDRRPARVNAVQFGLSEALLGTVDRLLDDYNAQASGERVGLAAVGDPADAARLSAQDGLYTLLLRGYAGEAPVKREQVVQCLLRALGPEELPSLAADADLAFALVDDAPEARAQAARFTSLREAAGLAPLPMLHLNGDPREGFAALADSLAFRAEPDEAARQCSEMNYLDELLHIAEPHARLTLTAPGALRARFPLDAVPGISFAGAGEYAAESQLRARVFEAGLCLMAAPGWLNGCDTLRDCMTRERLRAFVGEAFTLELLPALDDPDRPTVEARVIESFGRYEDPLNRNRLLRAADHLPERLARSLLPAIEAAAREAYEPPRRLTFALSASIMLLAGARPDPATGAWTVARGKQVEALHDDPDTLARFAALAHDMDPESLAYAVLADRELWGRDLRDIEGLLPRVALDLAAIQREPGYLPGIEN